MTNYVNPDELKSAYEECLQTGVLSNELAKMFYLIAVNYAKTRHFSSYQPKEELHAVAMEKLVKVWKKMKYVESGRAVFAWITTICHRAFLHHMITEQAYRERFVSMGLSPDDLFGTHDSTD